MRKIVVFNLISVDGFYAGKDDDISWHSVDDEFNQFAIEQTKSFGGIIFGRKTYTLFADFWPKALKDPKTSEDDRKVAQIIEDTWKLVFSQTLKEVAWNNAKLYHEIDPEEVKKWKQMNGKNLVIFGSGEIVKQFTNLGLIDEYRLLVNPVILGEGKNMFAGVTSAPKLQLTNTREFKNGNILLTYDPVR